MTNINAMEALNSTAFRRAREVVFGYFLVLVNLVLLDPSIYGEEIVTKNGTVYEETKISRIEPDGLVIMSDAGIEKVPFTELPEETQKKYSYDPSAAAHFRAGVAAAAQQRQAEAQAARQQKIAETARLEEKKNLEESAVTIKGKVLSVAKDGVLLQSAEIEHPIVKDVVVERSVLMGTPKYERRTVMERIEVKEPVFVYGVSGLVDGDIYAGKVHLAGTYSYVAALGNAKTVRAFATTEAIAQVRANRQK